MKVFSVFGISNTGKTTSVENIIKELTNRGYSVGSVKEIHFEQFKIDPLKETDTNRHKDAGSSLVTARGYFETDILYQDKIPMKEILKHYNHDYVVLEGVTDLNVPKIISAEYEKEIDERLDNTTFMITGKISNKINEYKGLEVLNTTNDIKKIVNIIESKVPDLLPNVDKECCSLCGQTCEEMLGNIINNKATISDCKLNESKISLKVDGVDIPMVGFVQNILRNSVVGVVSELDGYKNNSKIEIIINQ